MTPLDRIAGYAHVATRYGLEEAIFLDSIVYWYRENRANDRNFRDGRWWTYNSMRAFDELFPWWSPKQIRRIINSCREQGALLAGNYNEDQRDRTVWYSPGDEVLELYGVPKVESCICPNGQMDMPEGANSSAQTGEPLPCNNHVSNLPPIVPPQGDVVKGDQGVGKPVPDWALFERFWSAYPKKRYKDRARKSWKKLSPSLETCRAMSATLERDKQSRQWTKDDGEYIPYASTWLNNRPWEDGDEAGRPPGVPPEPLRGEGVRYL